jgi:glutathione S-transferase
MAERPGADLIFYHSPNTRSSAVLHLIGELEALYELRVLDQKAGANRKPAYLAVNPMGKVPAIVHGGELVTETVAIMIHLADAFPAAGLAPTVGTPGRGSYLRWMAYYAACFEPAVVDRALKREPGPPGMVPYGDFDTMLATLAGALEKGPWMLGDRFTALDVLWGAGLGWTTMFKLVPEREPFTRYIARCSARPWARAARERDGELAAGREQPRR